MDSGQAQSNPAYENEYEICDGNAPNGDALKVPDKTSKDSDATEDAEKKDFGLLYKLNDNPKWYVCIVLGLQHCLLGIGGIIAIPLILGSSMCMNTAEGYLGRAMILNSLLFTSGIFTFLQTTFGTRLPILQGPSFIFLPPALAILALPHNRCPSGPINPNITNGTFLYNDTDGMIIDGNELWQRRMREIQGAIAVASTVQILFSATGAVGVLMRFIGPLTVVPAIVLLGLSLYGAAVDSSAPQWGVAFFTVVILIIFSQYLRNVKLPLPAYSRRKGCHVTRTNFFQIFSVMIAIVLAWLLCLILTEAGALTDDPSDPGYRARTDAKLDVLYSSPWFRFSYPGQWGLPVVTGAGVVGMLAAVIAGMIESIGDYYACAKLSGAPPIPRHALNRGLAMEGLGCVTCGVLGTGTALTSYSQNIAALTFTRVGSRRVLQVAGIILFVVGMLGKFGAILVLIPDPVVGGLFFGFLGMLIAVGLSNLQYVDLNSPRNMFVLGFSIFLGLSVPIWVSGNRSAINTGVPELDQIFLVLLQTSILIGGVVGAFLDNTLPGTKKERGLLAWAKENSNEINEEASEENRRESKARVARCYNLPFSTKTRFSRYIPILPEFGTSKVDEDPAA